MAALGMQSVAAVGRFSHGPAGVSERERVVKSARSRSDYALKGLRYGLKGVAVSRRTSSLSSWRCRGSDESARSGANEDVDISDIVMDSSDVDASAMAQALRKSQASDASARPPKFTTLRPFGEGGAGVMSGLEGSLFELLAANIQATADLKKFETLSGRMAMMAFFVAIGVEVVTGNSVFKGIDVKELGQFAALSSVAALAAAGFAFAWRARSDVASSISKGALKLVDTAVDNVIDGLFYDEEETFKK